MWPFGKDARLREEFAEAATESIRRSFPLAAVRARGDSFEFEGLPVACDLESWFIQWRKSGHNGQIVLAELMASMRSAAAPPPAVTATTELDPPYAATVVAYDNVDRVGRLLLSSGEEMRFGATACKDFDPALGAKVFVTTVAPHPLGGRKAVAVRATAMTEAATRAEANALRAEQAAQADHERNVRREKALEATTHDAIVARIKAAVMAEEDGDADESLLYQLVEDLELMEPTLSHVEAILHGIAESPPMAHFGDPGSLVHYSEKFLGKGYEEAVFEVARVRPTSHFLWMLARLSGLEDARGQEALAIIRSYATHPQTPDGLRGRIDEFL
jgi:hypothetical protein